ncbi:MAG TPA: hypothetical protein VF981_15180 [Gemmatimonadaceae bacterium]
MRRFWPLMALPPFLVLAAAHWSDLPALVAGDYAQYLLHAKAIVEGRPYGDIGYLFTPYNAMTGPPLQPPGWPLLLAPVVAIFGLGLAMPKVLVTLAACVLLCAVAVRLARSDSRSTAVLSAAACGVALESSFATNSALSDLPFAAVLWMIIVAADTDTPLSWQRVLLLGLLGLLAISIRVVGVVIVPAFALLAVLRQRDRARLAVVVAFWTLLGVAVLLVMGVDRVPFLSQVIRAPEVLLKRITVFVPRSRYSLFEALLYPVPWNALNDIYHVAVMALVLPGLFEFNRRFGRSALWCVAVVTFAFLLVSPVFDSRYLWPLWPILPYSVIAGAQKWRAWLKVTPLKARRLIPVVATGWIVAATLTSLSRPSPPSLLGDRDIQDILQWARREALSGPLRVSFFSPRVLTLETGIPAMPWFAAPPPATIRELQRAGITHVILGEVGFLTGPLAAMEETVRSRPDAFLRVHSNPRFEVLRFTAMSAMPAGS